MFEKNTPVPHVSSGDASASSGLAVAGAGRGGNALRMIEWSELTARLNASRDLRRVLRQDAAFNIEDGAASFGDAAARYFRGREEKERDINLVALEACKASPGMIPETGGGFDKEPSNQGHAAKGDARDD